VATRAHRAGPGRRRVLDERLVALIQAWYEEGVGTKEIQARLREAGIPSAMGAPEWSSGSVEWVLYHRKRP
jgi:hypothetical protein